MTTPTKRVITVQDADELRDVLPFSGVFEMNDCEVEVACPLNATTDQIEKMVLLVESMINVTDVRVSGTPRPEFEDSYAVIVTDVPYTRATNKRGK